MRGLAFLFVSLLFVPVALAQPKKKSSSGLSESTGDTELDDMAAQDAALNSLQDSKLALGVIFPTGGSSLTPGAIGLRYMFSNDFGVTPSLMYSNDKQSDSSAYGFGLKAQSFFTPLNRASGYLFLQGSGGQNTTAGVKEDFAAGAALGMGAEVFLIRELSTSAEIGIGANFLPAKKTVIATTTSQISLHYHFSTGW